MNHTCTIIYANLYIYTWSYASCNMNSLLTWVTYWLYLLSLHCHLIAAHFSCLACSTSLNSGMFVGLNLMFIYICFSTIAVLYMMINPCCFDITVCTHAHPPHLCWLLFERDLNFLLLWFSITTLSSTMIHLMYTTAAPYTCTTMLLEIDLCHVSLLCINGLSLANCCCSIMNLFVVSSMHEICSNLLWFVYILAELISPFMLPLWSLVFFAACPH